MIGGSFPKECLLVGVDITERYYHTTYYEIVLFTDIEGKGTLF